MAVSRPILLGVKGEARRLLEEAGTGIDFEPEDSHEMTRSVLTPYRDRKLCQKLGALQLQYVESEVSYESLARQYLDALPSPT